MKPRHSSLLALYLGISLLAPSASHAKPEDVASVHRKALVIDAHADVYNPLEYPGKAGTIDAGTEVDVEKLRQGQVDAIFLSVHAPQGEITEEGRQAERKVAEAKLAAIRDIAARHPDKVALATTAADVRKTAASGRTAILISLLNGSPYAQDKDAVRYLYDRGVRMIGFVHMGNNELADSSRPFPNQRAGENGGLTPLGTQWVADANRLGVMLDVSQLSTDALMQTIRLSKAPVIASHSGIRAMSDTSRNLTDQELGAIAKSGGAVCVVAFSAYLVNSVPPGTNSARIAEIGRIFASGYKGMTVERRKELYAELDRLVPRASINQYIDSIDAAVKRTGIDHVCISSDFNHGVTGLESWRHEGQAQNITAGLLERGYSARDIDKLWGGNLLKVMTKVQALRRH